MIAPSIALGLTAWLAASTQTLGDAARRAEEQRRELPSTRPRTFSADDVETGEWVLTASGLAVYSDARAEIAGIRRSRPTLHQRLFDASRDVVSLSALAPAIAAEPVLVEILERYGLTPGEFFHREHAILSATAWAERRLTANVKERRILMANVEFVRRNRDFVRSQTRKYQRLEGANPWWNASRFVEP
jgi:hypothetical protein